MGACLIPTLPLLTLLFANRLCFPLGPHHRSRRYRWWWFNPPPHNLLLYRQLLPLLPPRVLFSTVLRRLLTPTLHAFMSTVSPVPWVITLRQAMSSNRPVNRTLTATWRTSVLFLTQPLLQHGCALRPFRTGFFSLKPYRSPPRASTRTYLLSRANPPASFWLTALLFLFFSVSHLLGNSALRGSVVTLLLFGSVTALPPLPVSV